MRQKTLGKPAPQAMCVVVAAVCSRHSVRRLRARHMPYMRMTAAMPATWRSKKWRRRSSTPMRPPPVGVFIHHMNSASSLASTALGAMHRDVHGSMLSW